MSTAMLFFSGCLHGTSAVGSSCAAGWLASCYLYSFSLPETQFIGSHISLPKNLSVSVRDQPSGFGLVGMVWFLASAEEGLQDHHLFHRGWGCHGGTRNC